MQEESDSEEHRKARYQMLLDQQAFHEGRIHRLNQEINRIETRHLSEWKEGNYKIGWSRRNLFSKTVRVNVKNRDKLFTLACVNS